ncbi:hypothetical protein KKH14_00280 [Patescibacteria group bacterium]|nr:hypothetical protein [Patescibacteria group bacterium]
MAKQIVAGDLYESLTGQIFEIGRQLRQPNGYPFDPIKLKRHLQDAIEGRFDGVSTPIFANDKTKDGWKLLENISRKITSISDLELVPFLKQGEGSISGEEMVRRAQFELDANYGQEDAEWLLEHQDEIPAEFQKYYIVFTRTIWRDSNDRRSVPYLRWYGGRWYLHFGWLGIGWSSGDRCVRSRK